MWAGFDGPQAPGALLDAIRDGRIGGVLLFAFRGNVRSKEQVRGMLREVQEAAARGGLPPVPVAVDQEGGAVVRIAYRAAFPSAMAIGATGDPSYAERAARLVAEGLRADGIAVNHAPVCDVNVEARNPVIGTRAFGDDPARVAELAAAWVRGSEGAGVATTPKHFPGHGATDVDSHHTTVDVKADRATLERRELAPFRAAIAAGASGVMSAHVRFPALDPDDIATLSRPIMTALLRDELGFRGLAMTDSLDMSGVTQVATPAELVGRCVRAGIDAVMVTSGIDRQLAASEHIATQVPAPRVLEALRRAAAFRASFGIRVPDGDVDDAPARALAAEIARRSITAVGAVPRSARWRVAYLAPRAASPVEELRDPAATFAAALRERLGDGIALTTDGSVPGGDAPLVVCTSAAAFDGEQADRARSLLRGAALHCAMRSPYDRGLVPPGVPSLLTYGDVPASLEALADVLAGGRAPGGRPPVRLA